MDTLQGCVPLPLPAGANRRSSDTHIFYLAYSSLLLALPFVLNACEFCTLCAALALSVGCCLCKSALAPLEGRWAWSRLGCPGLVSSSTVWSDRVCSSVTAFHHPKGSTQGCIEGSNPPPPFTPGAAPPAAPAPLAGRAPLRRCGRAARCPAAAPPLPAAAPSPSAPPEAAPPRSAVCVWCWRWCVYVCVCDWVSG